MQIIIISTNNPTLESYWQSYLTNPFRPLSTIDAKFIVVHEDWPGGAGNGLGTLYAFEKANQKAKSLYNLDLFKELDSGSSIAMYHTAGQGKRLYPLSASEGNNKSAVKLPTLVSQDHHTPLTMLEAVIRQSVLYSYARKGRLCVFWGDQVFQPSQVCETDVDQPVSIIAKQQQIPDEMEWRINQYDRYGLFAYSPKGKIQHLEKIGYQTLMELIDSKKIDPDRGISMSLGSFNLSAKMLQALLQEFSSELKKKNRKLDTDPHFWMPLTLDRETYVSVMREKQEENPEEIFDRMQKLRKKFGEGVISIDDIGARADWWDYGTVTSYFMNNLKLVSPYSEGEHMRNFYRVQLSDHRSCLLDCEIGGGNIRNSLLIGVKAEEIDVENCVVIGTQAPFIHGRYSMFYNVKEDHEISLAPGIIRADVALSDRRIAMYTRQGRDSKADWTEKLPQNPCSYEELYQKLNQEVFA